jgi:hypothetical protein
MLVETSLLSQQFLRHLVTLAIVTGSFLLSPHHSNAAVPPICGTCMAWGMASGAISSNLSALTTTIWDSAKSFGDKVNASEMIQANRERLAKEAINTQSANCRLATQAKVATATAAITSAMVKQSDDDLQDTINNGNNTILRRAAIILYKACQNGQLQPNDFGTNWFTVNKCINDPTTAHDFVRASTILASPVLIAPTQAQFDILNNPVANGPTTVAATWNTLNDKQKKYVGALRFCDNLVALKISPDNPINDANKLAANIVIKVANDSEAGKVATAYHACRNEVAQRTGVETTLLPSGAFTTDLDSNAAKTVRYIVNERGADPRLFYAYSSAANYAAGTPILAADGKPRIYPNNHTNILYSAAYGKSMACANHADNVTGAFTTLANIKCATLALNAETLLLKMRINFMKAVFDNHGNYIDQIIAPVRAENRPNYNSAPLELAMIKQFPQLTHSSSSLATIINSTNSKEPLVFDNIKITEAAPLHSGQELLP